ncbi:hypothetical protein GCM10018787_13090 [Streptomyces thermodiastaticus]|nr:hypothetical protein GCM10018787_13090 [Streptomyces thermodiastaticus]
MRTDETYDGAYDETNDRAQGRRPAGKGNPAPVHRVRTPVRGRRSLRIPAGAGAPRTTPVPVLAAGALRLFPWHKG